jgi:hypothetical protein
MKRFTHTGLSVIHIPVYFERIRWIVGLSLELEWEIGLKNATITASNDVKGNLTESEIKKLMKFPITAPCTSLR